jgi:radical SAM protein with 4Fe4S-binding SPASM domain
LPWPQRATPGPRRDAPPERSDDERVELRQVVARLADLAPGILVDDSGWSLVRQRGADLGERLATVFDDLFASGSEQVALVNADSPALPAASVDEALAGAAGGEVVLGPAADGGFYLVACGRDVWSAATRELTSALSAAPMGGSLAFSDLRARLHRSGLPVGFLPLWIDVDDVRDLPVMERLLGDDDTGLRGLPLVGLREVYIHITNRCQTGCPHCYNETNPRAADELSTDEWRAVIDECVALGAGSFVFSGGDPLLRTDLPELIEYITGRHGGRARFFFNGDVTSEMAALLAAAGRGRLRPLVSIDGTAAVNDTLRGAGNFNRALESVAHLRAVGLEPVANTVVLSPVLPVLPELAEELAAAGVRRLHLIFPHQRGGLGKHLDLVPSGIEMLAAVRALTAACERTGVVFDNLLSWRRRLSGRQDFCTAGCRDIAIDPYGKLSACTITCGDPAFVAGDVRRDSVETIWRGSPGLRLLRAARARDREECAGCEVVDACGGECWMQAHYAGRAHGARGGYASPFPYCDLVRPVFAELLAEGAAAGSGSCSGAGAAACGGLTAAGEADFTLFDCI